MEEGEQFLEDVFRLTILEKAFHVEESHQSFCLVPGELSCGSEFFRLLPRSGGWLFLLFQIFLLSQFFLALALQSLGFLLALLFEKGGFHGVEGFKEAFLPCGGLFAGEAHGQEGEAVASETVGGIFAYTYT